MLCVRLSWLQLSAFERTLNIAHRIVSYSMLTTNKPLARDAFARMNRRAIVMMFVRLSGTRVHDHAVHVSADLSSWLDSPMFWIKHVYLLQPSFSSSICNGHGLWINANCRNISRTVEDKG